MNRRNFLKSLCYGAAMITFSASYPVFIERNLVLVNHYKIPIPLLPPPFDGLRIAHLTDLHLGPLVSKNFIEHIIQRTNLLKPDITVCTGDYVHGRDSAMEIDEVWPLLTKLKARYGVYSVLGNHDHWADTGRSLYWLERSGHNIRHRCKKIIRENKRIIIGGCGDFWEDDLLIDQTFSSTDKGDCRILLAHNPDTMDSGFTTPLSLVLSGHTHGGQVSIPFYGSPILPVSNKMYSSGVIDVKETKLFISRGIGWAIYPVRFNCYPEIAVLELRCVQTGSRIS